MRRARELGLDSVSPGGSTGSTTGEEARSRLGSTGSTTEWPEPWVVEPASASERCRDPGCARDVTALGLDSVSPSGSTGSTTEGGSTGSTTEGRARPARPSKGGSASERRVGGLCQDRGHGTGRRRGRGRALPVGRQRSGDAGLPRRRVGTPGRRRVGVPRAADPGGLPVRAVLADDPDEAPGVPGGLPRLRRRPHRGVRRRRRGAADGRRGHRPQPDEGAGRRHQRQGHGDPARARRAGGTRRAASPRVVDTPVRHRRPGADAHRSRWHCPSP